jgi:hypothetical protein
MEGTNFELLWFSPNKWTEKVSTTDFNQLRIKYGDGIWEARNPPYQSLRVWQLMQALAFSSRLTLWQTESVGHLKVRQKDGIAEHCVQTSVNSGNLGGAKHRELCFNDASELSSEHYIPSDRTYEFANYSSIGNKKFPRHIRVYDGKNFVVDFSVAAIDENPPIDASAFMKPADAKWRKWCANPEPATPLPIPFYQVPSPPSVLHVTLFGTIGIDGKWHHLYVVESGGSAADASAAQFQLNYVRFKPATCDGVPVRTETAFRR